ncbi:MAG: hypothetical protein JWN48_775 [Myxococcaceae bacterium]|nr:hypothetical protein [Myxococcaceae bacterium]
MHTRALSSPRPRALALLAGSACAACAPLELPATAIVVSVKTDLTLGVELRELSYRVFRANADADRDAPVGEFTAAAETLAHPFVILQQHDDTLLLSVEGFARPAEEPVVVQRVRARFERGQTLALHVFLARACLDAFCEADGLTCFGQRYGQVEAGQCSSIAGPDPLDRVARAGDEGDWLPLPSGALDAGLGQSAGLARGDAAPLQPALTTSADCSR